MPTSSEALWSPAWRCGAAHRVGLFLRTILCIRHSRRTRRSCKLRVGCEAVLGTFEIPHDAVAVPPPDMTHAIRRALFPKSTTPIGIALVLLGAGCVRRQQAPDDRMLRAV